MKTRSLCFHITDRLGALPDGLHRNANIAKGGSHERTAAERLAANL
jgi:hypothetical protein